MKNNNRLFLDIHAIQTVPPSCINRDDTGSPKTAQYGGVVRARVSSQSWKRAMRNYFYLNSEQTNVGVRTLDIVKYIADKICTLDNSIDFEEAISKANKVINDSGIKTSNNKAKALFFLGDLQADLLAKAALKNIVDKNELKTMLNSKPAIDIALFGRMVADDPSLNEDASSQVAHAISTHSIQTEFDFFTAIDDLVPEDNAGAGMLGTVEYNSSTLYRYANVSIHELLNQLKNKCETINALKLFIESFANSMPTGKSNTFANQTLPQAILINVRNDRPVNLVSAFEVPVKSSEGFVMKSINNLFSEYKKAQKFVNEPLITLYITMDDFVVEDLEEGLEGSLETLLNRFSKEVVDLLPNIDGE